MTMTENRVNEILINVTGGDATVQRSWKNIEPKKVNYATFTEYCEACNKEWGYSCTDSYRPGFGVWAKSPADAARKAGFTI